MAAFGGAPGEVPGPNRAADQPEGGVDPTVSPDGSVARFGYLACIGDLIYAAMKVRMGLSNQIGIPGFPAAAGSYETVGNPLTAQLGNAAAGLLAALVVIIAVHLAARGPLRTIIATALVVATTVQLAGAAILLLRVTGLLVFPNTQVSGWAAWF